MRIVLINFLSNDLLYDIYILIIFRVKLLGGGIWLSYVYSIYVFDEN